MDRQKWSEFSENSTKTRNLYKHMIAAEAGMRSLARHFNEDVDKWGMAGLLHDIDYDQTVDDFENHARIAGKQLRELDIPEDIVLAVERHAHHKDNPPQTKMDWALYITDPLTGLIVAATLMHPTKKLAGVDPDFVLKRFKEKRFAAGANRDQIALCEEKLGLELRDFVSLVLTGMQEFHKELGL